MFCVLSLQSNFVLRNNRLDYFEHAAMVGWQEYPETGSAILFICEAGVAPHAGLVKLVLVNQKSPHLEGKCSPDCFSFDDNHGEYICPAGKRL